jgi:hypothetical protein
LLIACAGCWEEVHYTPGQPIAATPVVIDKTPPTTTITEFPSPEDAASNTEPPSTDSESLDSADTDVTDNRGDVTADDLFGTPDETVPSTQETPLTEADASSADIGESTEESERDEESFDPLVTSESSDAPTTEPSPSPDHSDPVPASDEPLLAETTPDAKVTPVPVELMRPSRTALAMWRMSSRWSLAAAIYAKGQPEERYRDSLDQAKYAATLLGVELTSFPVSEGMPLETAVIGYLLDADSASFVKKLGDGYVPEYEALAELAIRTNALLLVYTPKSQQLEPLVKSIRQAAEQSGLPPELWADLVSMLERREPFNVVKQRVLSFHAAVGDYLTGEG